MRKDKPTASRSTWAVQGSPPPPKTPAGLLLGAGVEPPLPWCHLHRLQELGRAWQQQQQQHTEPTDTEFRRCQTQPGTGTEQETPQAQPLVRCVPLGESFISPSLWPPLKDIPVGKGYISLHIPTPQRGCGAPRGGFLEGWVVLSHQLLAPAHPLPLPCRTCGSAAPGARSSSPARPPSSRGLWPRSSCLWTGIEPCVAPTGKSGTSPLGGVGQRVDANPRGPRIPCQMCSPSPKLGDDFPRRFGVGPRVSQYSLHHQV